MVEQDTNGFTVSRSLNLGDLTNLVAVVALYRYDRFAAWRLHSATITTRGQLELLQWALIAQYESRYASFSLHAIRIIEGCYTDVVWPDVIWENKWKFGLNIKRTDVLRLMMRALRKGLSVTVRNKRRV